MLPGPRFRGIDGGIIVQHDLPGGARRNARALRNTDLRAQIDGSGHAHHVSELRYLVGKLPPRHPPVARARLQHQVVPALLGDLILPAQLHGPAQVPGEEDVFRQLLEVELCDEEAIDTRQPCHQIARLAVFPADREGERGARKQLLQPPRR
jgi:hypothetical protein